MRFLRCLMMGLLVSAPVYVDELAWAGADRIDSVIETLRADSGTPFISAAVATAADVCHFGEYGGAPEEAAHIGPARFHAASISKLFTAIAIMQLQNEGKLSIEDRVGTYEPAFEDSPIKLVDLLTHTSGIRDRDRASALRAPHEVDRYIASLAEQKLPHRPGERWRYSDAGFNLLGRVVERVTARPFADAMRVQLLEPLGMSNSDFDIHRIPAAQRVAAFNKHGESLPHPWDLAFLPSSGLQTTAEDLAKFARAILAISANSNVATPIDSRTLRQMTRVRIATEWEGIGQGLGWQIAETEIGPQWRHAGGERGFEGLLTLYPERGFAIAVLGNKTDWPRFELEGSLRELLSSGSTECFN